MGCHHHYHLLIQLIFPFMSYLTEANSMRVTEFHSGNKSKQEKGKKGSLKYHACVHRLLALCKHNLSKSTPFPLND